MQYEDVRPGAGIDDHGPPFHPVIGFLYIASPQKGDLRLLGPPSGRGADGGARTRDRRVPADLRADSQATVPPTPPHPVISQLDKPVLGHLFLGCKGIQS
ncbi:hypothetical protein PoB_002781100 [Plakobranchus ocellatus]|uniref:Uncharacterized protein n=1 Tax=Plakobranchus ocellatus TaxID=259542 RepID=A0AAV4A3N4_9GAST|nr:hypothetical protein PoB_002781100 [Plakobranchus ocellatus]